MPVLRLLGTVAAVTSDDLTTEQAKQIGVVVGRHLNYLGRLQKRMQRVGFPHDDQLVVAVNKAFDATHALNVRLHYLGVASGVGSPPRGDRRDTPVQ